MSTMRYWTYTISRLVTSGGVRKRKNDAAKIIQANDRAAAIRLAEEAASRSSRADQPVVESVMPYSAGR